MTVVGLACGWAARPRRSRQVEASQALLVFPSRPSEMAIHRLLAKLGSLQLGLPCPPIGR
jgi:hypothetical protein